MAAALGSSDTDALITAFRPSPLPNRQSLFRSRSGGHVYHSSAVLARLDNIFAGANSRLSVQDLPMLLDVDDEVRHVLEYDSSFWWDSSEHSIVPRSEVLCIIKELEDAVRCGLVSLGLFLKKRMVSNRSYASVEARMAAAEWIEVIDPDTDRHFVTSHEYVDVVMVTIEQRIRETHAYAGKLNISEALSAYNNNKDEQIAMTHGVLRTLSDKVLEEMNTNYGTRLGSIVREHNQVFFEAHSWHDSQFEQQTRAQNFEDEEDSRQFEEEGYFITKVSDEEGDGSAQVARLLLKLPASIVLKQTGSYIGFMKPQLATAMQQKLQVLAKEKAEIDWSYRMAAPPTDALVEHVRSWLIHRCKPDVRLAKFLLSTPDVLDSSRAIYCDHLETSKQLERVHFAHDFEGHIAEPVRYYANGIGFMKDVVLRQKLDSFVTEFVRENVVTQEIYKWRSTSYCWSKDRKKMLEKLHEVCNKASSTAMMQRAIRKCAQRLGIEEPTCESLQHTLEGRLRRTLDTMSTMPRGTDLLQNTVWLLLSLFARTQGTNALFMSSGKDTSRMIRHYRAISNTEDVPPLEHWRDALKTGSDSVELRSEILQSAERAVTEAFQ